jgi:HEAT repeat protein
VNAPSSDPDRLVEDLAREHREKPALRALMAVGPAATAALRRGLRHADANVRVGCCKVLDHHMDEEAVPELIANLEHADPQVRAWAIHALACDRCKEGVCRPGESDVIPIAAGMLLGDHNRHVRAMAAGMLGPSVHRSAEALRALEQARDGDPHPAVRKIARWYTPGGPLYRKLAPRPARRPRPR